MKKDIIYILAIIILSVFAVLYFIKPRLITVTETVEKIVPKFETDITAPPDTVIVYKRITRTKKDTIIVQAPPDTTILFMDSYIDSKRRSFLSVKRFSAELLNGKVEAYAPCAVDSFHIQTSLNRDAFQKYVEANFELEKNPWYVYLGAGIITGTIMMVLIN